MNDNYLIEGNKYAFVSSFSSSSSSCKECQDQHTECGVDATYATCNAHLSVRKKCPKSCGLCGTAKVVYLNNSDNLYVS